MEYIPVKTRRLNPPKDDLLSVLDTTLPSLKEGDIVLVTSKVVAIDEGRCVLKTEASKEMLTRAESDYYLESKKTGKTLPLTIAHNALVYRAGIDEENSGEYYTLLPKDPLASAVRLRAHMQKKTQITQLGVVVTDSVVLPLRAGVTSIALGVAGFEAARFHAEDERDLFGNPVVRTSTNVADSLAAGGAVVSGEASESIPIVIVRAAPKVTFTDGKNVEESEIPLEKDLFSPILKPFYE